MRRLFTWLLVTLGIAALVRRLRRRSPEPTSLPGPARAAGSDPADELRRKLAETRAEEPSGADEGPQASVEDRRAEVHAEGRAALEEMKSSDEG